ncbi:glycosyltransferase [Geomonas azotofigens]|uniref:glycosyltransferase n=1 Tax=Geomonas azotofigens TaxID=2843196 RepID=UPI001C0F8B43|nr:glycosyltransferase [Geomonas azotofigens]MBU5613497.1 glycosyltransferase [Geomonas azotofigens]
MSNKDNILLVANYDSDVGYAWWLMENFWAHIAKHFSGTDRKCYLVYPKINKVPDIIKDASITLIEYDFSDRSLRSFGKLLKLLLECNIGYVYLTDRPYYDWRYLAMRVSGIRRIINHDHMPGERPEVPLVKKILKQLLHRCSVFSCDLYIAVSEFVKERAIDIACVAPEKCIVVHNGIRIFDNSNTSYVHDVFGLPKDAFIVVSTGRATLYKGIQFLIEAAEVVTKRIEKIIFLHIGDGPDLPSFEMMVNERGLASNFKFAGFRTDIVKILPSCNVGIQTSLGEAFSLSVLEYMCAGLVTLAPNNCGNGEAISDGVNGFLFRPENVDDIVQKIVYVYEHRFEMNRVRQHARCHVLDNFSITSCNQKLISALSPYLNEN